jgi:hypothetical protein
MFGLFRLAVSFGGAASGGKQAVGGRTMAEQETTRRELIQRAVYVAPTILTLVAIPAIASAGSGAESHPRRERLREIIERLQER